MSMPQIMILGSYHMANPGKDYANLRADDVLAPARQAQIETVVAALAAFGPTKIAIEADRHRQSEIDDAYQAYCRGDRALLPNEREQIGFRVAHRLGHARVHAVDYLLPLDIGGVFAWGSANGYGDLIASLQAEIAGYMTSLQAEIASATVAEILLKLNNATSDSLHGHYLTMATIGAEDAQPGTEMTTAWYARNLRIFANIAQLVQAASDRVLVIFGSGHGPLLRQFIRECPLYDLADVRDFVKG